MNRTLRFVSVGIAAWALVLGCGDRDAATRQEARTSTEGRRIETGTSTGPASARSILEDPLAFMGQEVTLTAEVEDVHSPQLFTIQVADSRLGDQILVVSTADLSLRDDQRVRIVGRVEEFRSGSFDRSVLDRLRDSDRAQLEAGPVIVATSVRPD
ncbi:MAG TPA: hypothetical protein VM328_08340 [Fimbriimonadaceae bacterium]|nr:hypothetical protein [Fimbriimonadaceae bacterium]